jgi:putative transposase
MRIFLILDVTGEWKLAHELTNRFDVLCFETLNLKGMQRLWGRKISDLAFGEFLQILEWVALKLGKQVVFVDQWFPSSKTCHHCGHVLESLDLSVREWRCPSCQMVNGRDQNAAREYLCSWGINCWLRRCQTGNACNCCLRLESPEFSKADSGEYVKDVIKHSKILPFDTFAPP